MNILESEIKKAQALIFYEAKLGGIQDPNEYQKSYGVPVVKVDQITEILIGIDSEKLRKFGIEWHEFTRVAYYLIDEKILPIEFTFKRDMVNQDEYFGADAYDMEHAIIFLIKIPKDFISELELLISDENRGKKYKSTGNESVGINIIEVSEDKTENKAITIYINENYSYPRSYRRGKNWGLMYELAKDKSVSYDKSFFDYFNSSKLNPLYAKEGFKITQILKQEQDVIVPNIDIEIVTQKKVTTRKPKSA